MKKKILALFLAIALIVSCTIPAGAIGRKINFPSGLPYGDYPRYLQNEIYKLDDIWNLERSEATLQAIRDFKPDQLTMFFSGLATLSSGISLVNGTFAFLKMVGVIEDPTTKMLRSIQDSVADILEAVNEVNMKMDELVSTLNAEFSRIDMSFNLQRYETFQAAWTQFFTQGAVKDLDELTDAYESEINSTMLRYAKKWQSGSKTGVRALYDTDSMLVYSGDNIPESGLKLPQQPAYSSDSKPIKVETSITLPADYIEIDDVKLTANNYVKYIKKAFEQGVLTAAEAGDLVAYDTFYDIWNNSTDSEKKSIASSVAADLFDSFCYAVSYTIANQSDVERGTFASQFKVAFESYCQTLQGENAVTSPITAALEKLTLTHTFEGEVAESFGDIITMLATMTLEYGTLATYLTELDDSMTRAEKDSVVKNNQKTYNVVLGSYDMFITGYDNYCYPVKGLVEYRDAYLLTEVEAVETGLPDCRVKTTIPWTVVDTTLYKVSDTREKKDKVVNDMKGLLSLRDVSLLYYYYEGSGFDGDFMSYLDENDAIKVVKIGDYDYNTNIITSDYKVETLPIDGNVRMISHAFGFTKANFIHNQGEVVALYKPNYLYKYFANQKVTGSLFDVAAGTAGTGTTGDVKGRTILNQLLGRMAIQNFFSEEQYYGITRCFTDGAYFKASTLPGSKEDWPDSKGGAADATYTVATGYNYGALVIVPIPTEETEEPEKTEENTASVFGTGNIALICGGVVLLCAVGFGFGYLLGGKKKTKKEEVTENI